MAAVVALIRGHTSTTTSTHQHEHSTRPHTKAGVSLPAHRAQNITTATFQALSSLTANILKSSSSLASCSHAKYRQSKATAWSQKYQPASRTIGSIRLHELAYMGWSNWKIARSSKWQVHIPCVCSQHQRIHFLSSSPHQTP